MGKLFGTDGIRGVAGARPLDADTVYRIGAALSAHLETGQSRPSILIARDTRLSGPWIEEVLRGAIADHGGATEVCGVIPTPALSVLTMRRKADAGVMISASHNPYEDNGIKIFSGSGVKFSDEIEDRLEQMVSSIEPGGVTAETPRDSPPIPDFGCDPSCRDLYLEHLRASLPDAFDLDGIRLVVDCAHGADFAIAPPFLRSLGAEVHAIHCEPDGRNINRDAGALHLDALRAEVRSTRADLGIAFDGDGDRAMLVDRHGTVRDGDDMLFLLAAFSDTGDAPRVVVGTVMANLGLEIALESRGFGFVRTAVGDRYVLEEMMRLGAEIGGEQSGHIILARHARTGDGLLTACKVLQILRGHGMDIREMCSPLRRLPQVLLNVRVGEKIPFSEIPGLREREAAWRERLGPRSRILLRYSGTEDLGRVMVEGEDETLVRQAAGELASLLEAKAPSGD